MWVARKTRSFVSAGLVCALVSSSARAEPPGPSASAPVQEGLVEPPPAEYRPTPPPVEEPPNTLAYVSLVSGGVLLATGIGFGVASVIAHRTARDFEQQANADDEELETEAKRQYDEAIGRRDDFRVASGVAGGVGLGLFVFSGILFARAQIRRDALTPPSPASPVAADRFQAHPVIGPGVAGGAATVTF
jgi:hypothetical protein